ncbi:14 kDa antigen [Sphaerisporangium siamense]|uniref:HSP20 family molecular chaperone IbpA n=1 Tax=Sphaerisporangium siamense TaxID=795645 RepID=A0A7W7GDR1_9ACTN|nr:Hsp20/alpha crystallin family protein [Sphaerisporangium siamense]MBB4703271.1 HSP20 family molecular chaperone IbpA [Sphaerisporangium siamense]GII88050.1 14 kDa antigen [Sphaerisporangium siamense]
MAMPTRRQPRGLVPDLLDWLEAPFSGSRPYTGARMVRFEDTVKDGHYIVRAELPGINPEADVEVTVENGMLTVRGERKEEKSEPHRTEFVYGEFSRTIPLPPNADETGVKAVYHDGILEVDVPLAQDRPEAQRVPIEKQGG